MNLIYFKNWLFEDEQKDYEFYKNLILGKLNSGKKEEKYDVSTSLNVWKPVENLISSLENLGEFKIFDVEVQKQVLDKINSKEGTLDDIIRLIARKADKNT
jgi:hypothetical protein